ncbi:MAG: TauD/TfdA family dioxygenase [Myxococcales bacterium]|nr:TauD/TfdA family dioxygenase [Myxococcales bacterium]
MRSLPAPSTILASLRARGFYRSDVQLSREEFLACMRALGDVKKPTEIRPRGPNPVLESGRPLLAHNDCNYYADFIAWYCRDDGGAGDRTFIVDAAPLLASLSPEELARLARVRVVLPNHEGGGTTVVRWQGGAPRLFYVPWALFHDGDPVVLDTLRRFHARVKEHTQRERVQGGPIALRSGEFLIVDDGRFMHGRDAVPDSAPRHLLRVYVKAASA